MARIVTSSIEAFAPREAKYERKQFKNAADLTGQAIAQANAVYESGIPAAVIQGAGSLYDTVSQKARDYFTFKDLQDKETADAIVADATRTAPTQAEGSMRAGRRGLETATDSIRKEEDALKADEIATLEAMQADARLRSGPSVDEILKRSARERAKNRGKWAETSRGTETPASEYERKARSTEETPYLSADEQKKYEQAKRVLAYPSWFSAGEVTDAQNFSDRIARRWAERQGKADALRVQRDIAARGPTTDTERAQRYDIALRLHQLDPENYPMPAPEVADPFAVPAAERDAALSPIQRVARSRAAEAGVPMPAAAPVLPTNTPVPAPTVPRWQPTSLKGGPAVSASTQAAAAQSQDRAEAMRAGMDAAQQQLDARLIELGSVGTEMADKAKSYLADEQKKVADSDAAFLKETEQYLDPNGPPVIIRDATGKAIDYKSREPITINKLASLARMADTPEKQARIMELSSQINVPYRTLSERLDPQRMPRFLKEIEGLFPAARKSPVEIALNNALLASKFVGAGESIAQKEKNIALKQAGVEINRDKLAHLLDQDQFKNASMMDKIQQLERLGIERNAAMLLAARIGAGSRNQPKSPKEELDEAQQALAAAKALKASYEKDAAEIPAVPLTVAEQVAKAKAANPGAILYDDEKAALKSADEKEKNAAKKAQLLGEAAKATEAVDVAQQVRDNALKALKDSEQPASKPAAKPATKSGAPTKPSGKPTGVTFKGKVYTEGEEYDDGGKIYKVVDGSPRRVR